MREIARAKLRLSPAMAASNNGSLIATSGGEPHLSTITRVSEDTMRQLFISFLPLMFMPACGGGFADITGSIAGEKISDTVGFWGGPYVVFTASDVSCNDLSWVNDKYSLDTDELATQDSFNALQFTYASSEVQDGKLTIAANNSPATGWFVVSDRGEANTYRSVTGNIDTTIDGDWLSGTFDVSFGEDGSMDGEFEIEKCINLKPRR